MRKILAPTYYDVFSKIVPNYYNLLGTELKNCNTVLELGCGTGSPFQIFSKNHESTGVDIFKKSIDVNKKKKIHNKYLLKDVLKLDLPKNSFDCVIALDLVEHFKKKEGLKLLKLMERWAKKKVIIFTPNGFLEHSLEFVMKTYGNKHQQHLSGWDVGEMKELGYRVSGAHGLRWMRGEGAQMKYSPKLIWFLLSELSQFYVKDRPSKAFHLFCVKDVSK